MAAVARAGPHRRVKDDQVVAHYPRAGEGSPGVIRIGELAERMVGALPRLCVLRIQSGLRAAPAADTSHDLAGHLGKP